MVKNLIQKRKSKSISLENYTFLRESRKVRRKAVIPKKYSVNLSQRHKFKRISQKFQDFDPFFEENLVFSLDFPQDCTGFSFFLQKCLNFLKNSKKRLVFPAGARKPAQYYKKRGVSAVLS